MTTAPTQDEAKLNYALLWEIAEGKVGEDAWALRRIAGFLERQQAEIERLRQAVEGKRAA